MTVPMTRREFAIAGGAALLAPSAFAQNSALLARAIPSSGERLPAVGLGTAYVFDANDETTRQKAVAVLAALIAGGGRLVDTSSVYGEAETVLGEAIVPAGLREKLFIATKLEAPNAAELKRSQARIYRCRSSTYSNSTTCAIRSNRWRSSRNGRHKVSAAISASPRPATNNMRRSKRCSCAKSPILCRSITRLTTARSKSAFCRPPPKPKPQCLPRYHLAALGCFAQCVARTFPTGRTALPTAGRNSS